MILDSLRNKELYYPLCPRFKKAFEWLEATDIASLATGRHAIDGDDIFVNVSELDLRPRSAAALEVHDKYIDIQIVAGGAEEFGWSEPACLRIHAVSSTQRRTYASTTIRRKPSTRYAKVNSRY